MEIGRITDLPEMTSLSMADAATVSMTLVVTEAQARRLLDLAANGAEQYVPIVSTSQPDLDGLYRIETVTADADPNLDKGGRRQVALQARRERRGKQIANSLVLVRGDNRNRVANVGVGSPFYCAALPGGESATDGAQSITSYNAGPAGFDTAFFDEIETLRGWVRRVDDRTQPKQAVARATTANIALTGTVSVDGGNAANGSRVLVKNQTTASQNGVYVVNTAGAWTRATDCDTAAELEYMDVTVTGGSTLAGTSWFLPLASSAITVGTTALNYQQGPRFGLRDSPTGGPVSISYDVDLDEWYNGACTVVQNGNVVVGNSLDDGGTVTIDNGLLRFGLSGNSLTVEVATGSPLTWRGRTATATYTLLVYLESADVTGVREPTLLTNSPDVAALRYRFTGGSMDVSLARGSRVASIMVNASSAGRLGVQLGSVLSGTYLDVPEAAAATAVGFGTSGVFMQYQNTNDTYGNRLCLIGSGAMSTTDLVTGLRVYPTTASRTSHAFGVGVVIGGGTTKTGSGQLYELARQWYAAQAQRTSAGVL
jgi:hypothetical protein